MSQPQFRPPPQFFLVIFLEGNRPKIVKWEGEELFLSMLVLPLQCGDSWWAVPPSQEARVSGSQAPGSIKGGATHPGYWAASDGGPSVDFHSLLFRGYSGSVFGLVRSHNILLRIVKVIEQCLLREPAWLHWSSWGSADGTWDRTKLGICEWMESMRMDGWMNGWTVYGCVDVWIDRWINRWMYR